MNDSLRKANTLSNQFKSVFTKEDLDNMPPAGPSLYPDVPPTVSETLKLLTNVNPKEANGPDLIPCPILKEAATEIVPFLRFLFAQSLESGIVPIDWLKGNITPIFKKGSKHLANYPLISLTAVPCKILEHIIFHDIMAHLDSNNIPINSQHGFRRNFSCETQLITTVEKIAKAINNGKQTDLIIMDFSKAFVPLIPHQRLINKLDYDGIRGHHKVWLTNWLTRREQTVVVDGVSSPPVHVSSGVPQGTVLGPLMFLLCINDISGSDCSSTIRLFADDTILYSIVESLSDAEHLQSDLSTIERWSQKCLMQFNPPGGGGGYTHTLPKRVCAAQWVSRF